MGIVLDQNIDSPGGIPYAVKYQHTFYLPVVAGEDDEGLDDLTAVHIGAGHHCRLLNSGVLQQRRLHLHTPTLTVQYIY